MRALIERMRACADEGDAHGQALANSEFHTLVISASGNRTVQRLWEILEPFARTYLTATGARRGPSLACGAPRRDRRCARSRVTPSAPPEQMRVHAREAEAQVMHETMGEAIA